MKLFRTSLKKNKNIFMFLLFIFIIGFIFGIIYYFKLPQITKNGINDNLLEITKNLKTIHLNYFFYHNIIFLLIFFLSFTVIFFPIILFYLFYEGVTLGFSFIIFLASFKISGLFFAIILFLLTKMIYIIFIFYMIFNSYNICKIMIVLILKKNNNINLMFKIFFQRLIIILLFISIYNIFLYFFGSKILYLFKFLLK